MLDMTAFDPRELRDTFGRLPTGVTAVTFHDGEGRASGATIGSFTSLSLDPPLCLFSIARDKSSARWIIDGNRFAVNVLARTQEDIAWQLARADTDKLASIDWTPGDNGAPLIDGAVAQFECSFWNSFAGGDHVIIVGRVTAMTAFDGDPLVFCRGRMAGLTDD